MTENQPNEPNLGDELRNLGKNLSEFLRAAWASEEPSIKLPMISLKVKPVNR